MTLRCVTVEMQSDVKRLQALQLLVLLLPVEHSTLLRRLLNLLQCVVDEPENRMTADNLAILFVPHIIVPRKVDIFSVSSHQSYFSQHFLQHNSTENSSVNYTAC